MIRLANRNDLDFVVNTVHKTVLEIYPKYYPKGSVEDFIIYHNKETVLEDIVLGRVYILEVDNSMIGTISIRENEFYRFFILEEHQRKGYGSILLKHAENIIFSKYDYIQLDASLTGKSLYLKHGYHEKEYVTFLTDSGDYTCYDIMIKQKKN